MWKRLDATLAISEKHSSLHFNSLRVWLFVLPHTDCTGRYSADARLVKSQCLPLVDMDIKAVGDALQDLESVGLIHLYEVAGKRCLVYHDHDQWNPIGGLKYQKSKWPNPPSGSCKCIGGNGVVNAVGNVDSHVSLTSSSSLPSKDVQEHSSLAELEGLAVKRLRDHPETVKRRLKGWVARWGSQTVGRLLGDDSCRGMSVIEFEDFRLKPVSVPRKPGVEKATPMDCSTCGNQRLISGKVFSDLYGREVDSMKPCPNCTVVTE